MLHISEFSGIGGFELAAQWMGWKNIVSCEINEFGNKVLEYYWPNAYHHKDIHTLTYDTINTELTRRFGEGWRNEPIVLTGGFPCQPFSMAGKRKGTEDDRHLWPEMLRTIREIAPEWVVGENVFGLINWDGGLVFNTVQADLEAEGYEVQSYVLPACGVGAPHRRDRIFFVAHSKRKRGEGGVLHGGDLNETLPRGEANPCCPMGEDGSSANPENNGCCRGLECREEDCSGERCLHQCPGEGRDEIRPESERSGEGGSTPDPDSDRWSDGNIREGSSEGRGRQEFNVNNPNGGVGSSADPLGIRDGENGERGSEQVHEGRPSLEFQEEREREKTQGRCDSPGDCRGETIHGRYRVAEYPDGIGQERGLYEDEPETSGGEFSGEPDAFRFEPKGWDDFPTVSPLCSRNDEFPGRLSGITFSKWRNEGIRALGNAVVPALILQIFKAIQKYNDLQ